MSTHKSNTAAGIYVRISRDSEADGLGVARQRQDCAALAESLGWHVIDIFEDNDVSASTGKRRPAYERMAREVEAGRIGAVVVWDVDRLTRTPRELEDVIGWAEQHGLKLANVGGEIDLSTPQGRMTARIKGTVARHEVEQSSRRIRRKRVEMAEQGRYVGPRPYGWSFAPDKRLIINEAEAAVVREAVSRILSGDSLKQITRDLNDRGITTVRGGQWVSSNVRKMLLRSTNAAIRVHQGREVGPGDWPPIVSREDHDRVVSILTDPKRRTNNRGTAEKYLLSGIVKCADCGESLLGATATQYRGQRRMADGTVKQITKSQPQRYRCVNRGCFKVSRRMDQLDEFVTESVLTILERDGVEVLGGDTTAAETARARIDALEAKLSIVADQFADDMITGDQFQRITAKVRPQLDQARAELGRAMPAADGLTEFAGPSARQAWQAATLEQKRIVIRTLTDGGLSIKAAKAGRRRGRNADPAPFDAATVRIEWSHRDTPGAPTPDKAGQAVT